MLLVVPALCPAAEKLTLDAARELFPSAKTCKTGAALQGLTLRIEGCPCVVVPDDRLAVRYFFLLPTEKGKRSPRAMEKARPVAESLAEYLQQRFGKAELTPFADGESGFAIALPKTSYESYPSTCLGQSAATLIDKFLKTKGHFFRCESNEIVLKMPCPEAGGESCFVSFPLLAGVADVIGYTPGRSARRTDEKVAASAENLLGLRTMYTAATSSSYASRLKDMRSATGATKCIAVDSEGTGIASYRNRYYIGTERHLKDYIRNKKRAGRGDKFQFPTASASVPELPVAVQEEPAVSGAGRTPKGESPRAAGPSAVSKATEAPENPQPSQPESRKPLTPDAALKDYVEYLRRLMK